MLWVWIGLGVIALLVIVFIVARIGRKREAETRRRLAEQERKVKSDAPYTVSTSPLQDTSRRP